MTIKETAELLGKIESLYPMFYRNSANLKSIVQLWHECLEEYSIKDIEKGLRNYFTKDERGYPPTVGQIIAAAFPKKKRNTYDYMTEE